MFSKRTCSLVAVSVLGVVLVLFAENSPPQKKATTETLGGPERYLTSVSTDKPIYRAKEKVYVRGVILQGNDHTPLKGNQTSAMIEIKGPKGDVVASGWAASQDSVLGYAWEVPAEQAGGQYTVKVSYPIDGYPPAERKFDIRAYRAPRLKSQIVFLRDGYGPGDEVGATLHTERAEGGIPQGAKINVSARVDNAEVYTGPATVDAQGNCTARFKLPQEIARGEGTLAFVIDDGGAVETAAKTIPILLQTVDLEAYPEGGDLVANLPSRVYLQAKTPAQKPADIAGVVLDDEGNEVAQFRTEHEGRGRFNFTPKSTKTYRLKITQPAGIKTTYSLPQARSAGAVIQTLDDRTPKGEPVRLKVLSTESKKLTVTLTKREIEVASLKLDARANVLADVTLTPPASAEGVLIATLWDEAGQPLAERLVYREPAKSLRVTTHLESATYTPGEKVNLIVQTMDETGEPLGAIVGLTVTDDSMLEMIEKREQAPQLPVMVLLESDVRELADAHVYLDEKNPHAAQAVDLLLGTQGWRRFAFVQTETFIKQNGDAARRVLALRMPSQQERERVYFIGGRGGAPGEARRALKGNFVDGLDRAAIPLAAPIALGIEARQPEGKAEVAEKFKQDLPKEQPADRKQLAKALADARDEGLLVADKDMGRRRLAEFQAPRQDFVAVRVYAHESRPDRHPGDRIDFTETLYWNAGIKTDEKTGKATLSFNLNDAVTTFRVLADGFNSAGALGSGTATVQSVQPFFIEPKLPLEVTSGDQILMPVGVVNGLSQSLADVHISADARGEIGVISASPFNLESKERTRRMIEMNIGKGSGTVDLAVHGQAGPFADNVTRKLTIKPLGFPVELAFGGMLGPDAAVTHTINIPENAVSGSITSKIAVYPTPLANMTAALERLIQEPNGCFEQTSSTVYPLVMAQQYFMSHTGVDPKLIERSKEMLDKGYAKLASFECKQKGYEWFGADPGHEALTAYGLLEFADMAQVRQVDRAMSTRTREWLLKRRDGKGGFSRDAKALDSFGGAPESTTNAYIVWSLLSSGEKGLDSEIASLKAVAATGKDSYVVALAANASALGGDNASAKKFMDALVKQQAKDGSVAGAVTSITRSGGDALQIEATSLAVLAWLHDPAYAGAVEKGIRYLSENCKAGRFGSTQSTVLALRAIVAYDQARATPKAPGSVRVYVDGQPIGGEVGFDAQTQGSIELPDIASHLKPGKHSVELKMEKGSSMPYALAVNYYDTQPASSKDCKVGLSVTIANQQITEGAVTESGVVVSNLSNEALPTPVAIIGLPGGLEPRHDQLKELVKSGKIDAYEVIGRDLVFYWRQLKPEQQVKFPVSLVAAIPGTYTGPASRAYLYYSDEFKTWTPGATVVITPLKKS